MKRPSCLVAAFAALACLSFLACSGKPPSFLNFKYLVMERPLADGAGSGQSLSVFAAVQDPDGFDDIESMYLINDQEKLFWKLTSDTWAKKLEGDTNWIGSNGFSLPVSESIPQGNYRVIVVDTAGEKAEREFSLGAPSDAVVALKATLSGDSLEISSPYPSVQVLYLDANGQTLLSLPGKAGRQSIKEQAGAYPEYVLARSIVVLSVSEGNHHGFFSQRLSLP
jgi:hypothetical protein